MVKNGDGDCNVNAIFTTTTLTTDDDCVEKKDVGVKKDAQLKSGKHKGDTYQYTYDSDKKYIKWLRDHPRRCGDLPDFLVWLADKE